MNRPFLATLLVAGMTFSAAIHSLPPTARTQNSALKSTDESRYARGPYSTTAEQSLVALEVSSCSKDGSAQQIRRGNGLLLRPDGFVLAPVSLFSRTISVAGEQEEVGSLAISVLVQPGTPNEKRYRARPPRYVPKDSDYTVLKADEFFAPVGRLVLPDVLRGGEEVEILSAPWESEQKRFSGLVKRKAVLAPPERGVKTDEKDAATLKPGEVRLTERLTDVTAGAVVLYKGKSIGLVTGTKPDRFVSYALLHLTTNCITADSRLDTPRESDDKAAEDKANSEKPMDGGEMVGVPGGPVAVPAAVLSEQPDMEGAVTACLAPFEIDKYEVTNEAYQKYWLSLPGRDRERLGFQSNYYPHTWSKSGTPFPDEIAKLPVLGVPLPGMMGYARWCGKRLPTPYEWTLAAFGPGGEGTPPDWTQRYIREHKTVWDRVTQEHMDFYKQNQNLFRLVPLDDGVNTLPWIARTQAGMELSRWSKQTVQNATRSLWAAWADPLYVLPVGSRAYDTSPYGAMDMLLNASEAVQPAPVAARRGEARFLESRWVVRPPKPDAGELLFVPQPSKILSGEYLAPPLSRLYRRTYLGPDNDTLLSTSSVSEELQMILPLASWRLVMTGVTQYNAAAIPLNRPGAAGLSPGYQLWAQKPAHYLTEIGMPVPLDAPDPHVSPGPSLFYYTPAGFRCAR